MPILRLVIGSPLRRLFDYLPPESLDAEACWDLPTGIRIRVPFGHRSTCGILLEVCQDSEVPADKLRHAQEILDEEPLLDEGQLALCLWAADYYKHPPGEILNAALPPALRDGKPYSPAGVPHWRLSTKGLGLPEGAPERAPKQAQLLEMLRAQKALQCSAIQDAGFSAGVLRQLVQKELVEEFTAPPVVKQPTCEAGLALTKQQQQVLSAIDLQDGFQCYLLEGVTGSGKTEVYLQLIARCLSAGRQVLVLVPEIGLTPQTLRRFQKRFKANIGVMHSGLAEGARQRAWDDARHGRAHIVLGTRSAIFTALPNLGLIIIDEEHDASFKQQDGFRYSARDVAVKRAQNEDIPILLGTATPSLESLNNALSNRYQHLQLTERANNAAMPQYETVDLRGQALRGGLSPRLLQQISDTIGAGDQVLLFLNRRGYAPSLQCHDCGYIAGCKHCDARLTLHRKDAQLRCHHCGWQMPVHNRCPECQSSQLVAWGMGTERLEQNLAQLFPDTPVLRIDRDSMSRRGAMDRIYEHIALAEPCILLGTQMLSKGHHFPNVTLVSLIDIDNALFSADFRGPERMGQLITQVAGRAGRGDKPGQVLLQTHYPDHPQLQTLLGQGYGEFARQLLGERVLLGMPPSGQLIMLRAEANQRSAGETFLHSLREQACQQQLPGQCVGPLPAPLQRRQGRYRWQLMVRCESRPTARASAEQLVAIAEQLATPAQLRWSIDIDPQDML